MNKSPKILFFGCQSMGLNCLKYLLSEGNNIVGVVTSESIADKKFGYPLVSNYAKKIKLPLYTPRNPKANTFIKKIQRLNPDLILSVYYRKILPQDILSIPKLGCVNIHPSYLPKYRGCAPTLWAILNNEYKHGITLHYMVKRADMGDIIVQRRVYITRKDTGYSLHNKTMRIGFSLFKRYIDDIIKGTAPRKPQKHIIATYFGQWKERYRLIDWNQSALSIWNKIRALTKPYSGAKTYLHGKPVIIWKSRITKKQYSSFPPGQIIDITTNKKPIIVTKDKSLVLEDFEAKNNILKIGDIIR